MTLPRWNVLLKSYAVIQRGSVPAVDTNSLVFLLFKQQPPKFF